MAVVKHLMVKSEGARVAISNSGVGNPHRLALASLGNGSAGGDIDLDDRELGAIIDYAVAMKLAYAKRAPRKSKTKKATAPLFKQAADALTA